MADLADRLRTLHWNELGRQLDEHGYAVSKRILSADECRELIALFDDDDRYRSIIDMRRHRFGSGVYKYFDRPLPAIVQQLRTALYRPLADIANDWAGRLGDLDRYPGSLGAFIEQCRARNQMRPTPLLFRYEQDDFNRLHQDVYGPVAFPLQALVVLSRRDRDFTGGEFLLVTNQPRAQSIGEVVSLDQGQILFFPNQSRPLPGARGHSKAAVRHGVSRVRSGTRHALGIIFHDAE